MGWRGGQRRLAARHKCWVQSPRQHTHAERTQDNHAPPSQSEHLNQEVDRVSAVRDGPEAVHLCGALGVGPVHKLHLHVDLRGEKTGGLRTRACKEEASGEGPGRATRRHAEIREGKDRDIGRCVLVNKASGKQEKSEQATEGKIATRFALRRVPIAQIDSFSPVPGAG